jgi:phosphate transport system substrate-binding protein
VPGKTGTILPLRRDDASGTTDAFKHFTGLKAFGPCVKDVSSTENIADLTSRDASAIGYSGKSAERFTDKNEPLNRALAIARTAGAPAVLPSEANVRDFSYPMARKLYVYSVVQQLSQPEKDFLSWITDRSNMDPIMMENDFFTED